MSKILAIGIIVILLLIIAVSAFNVSKIYKKVDDEGITHFKIDDTFTLPLSIFIMLIWFLSVMFPIRYYRITIVNEIQQAKECADERYEHCPHCGKKLEYSKEFPWSDETIQNTVERSNNRDYSTILRWLCETPDGEIVVK